LSLREVLAELRHVDHHAHSILRAPPAGLDAFRGLFSEASDPRQWKHVATTVTYQRAIALIAGELGCEATEEAVLATRASRDPQQYAARMMRAAGAGLLLVDEGYPPAHESLATEELGRLAGCPTLPILRIEGLASPEDEDASLSEAALDRIACARRDGFIALKTVIAYRGGLDLEALSAGPRDRLLAALRANRDSGDPLPVQVHTGFGDPDLSLPLARPGYLKPLFEGFPDTTFVLLHCYPFVREAGWLASVYPNVFFDLSLTIPHVSRPGAVLAEALELAPLSKLLFASDAVRTPELYLLAAAWWRDALAQVLPALLPAAAARDGARLILRENARALYRL
jgi:hypothetical protein